MLPEILKLDILHNGKGWDQLNQGAPKVINTRASLYSLLDNLDSLNNNGKNYLMRIFEPAGPLQENGPQQSAFILAPDQKEGVYRLVVGAGIKRPICFASIIFYDEKAQLFKVFRLAKDKAKETALTRRVEIVDVGSEASVNPRCPTLTRKREVHYILYEDGVRKGRLFGFQKPTRDGEEEERITIPTKVSRMQVVGINPLLIVALSKLYESQLLFPIFLTSSLYRNTANTCFKKFLCGVSAGNSALHLEQLALLDGELEEELSQLRMFWTKDVEDILPEDEPEKDKSKIRRTFLTVFSDLNAREDIPEPVHLDCATEQMLEVVHTRFPQSIRTRTRFERKDGLVLGLLKEALTFAFKDGKPRIEAAIVKELIRREANKNKQLTSESTLNEFASKDAFDIIRLFFKNCFRAINIFRDAFFISKFINSTSDPLLREIATIYLKKGIEAVKIISSSQIDRMFEYEFQLFSEAIVLKNIIKSALFKAMSICSMLELPMEALLVALEKGINPKLGDFDKKFEETTSVDSILLRFKTRLSNVRNCKGHEEMAVLLQPLKQEAKEAFKELLDRMMVYVSLTLQHENPMQWSDISEFPGMKDHMGALNLLLHTPPQ